MICPDTIYDLLQQLPFLSIILLQALCALRSILHSTPSTTLQIHSNLFPNMQIASSPPTAEPTIPTPGMRIAIQIHRKITVMLIRAPKALIPVRERYHRRIHPPRRYNHHIQQVAVRPNARPGRRVRPAHPPDRHTDVVEEGDVELVFILRGVGLLVLHNMSPAPPRREPAYRLPTRGHVLGATAPGMPPPRRRSGTWLCSPNRC